MLAVTLLAPFPYAGGKRAVAAEVWRRFGDVRSYVEPFAGSLAVLLQRPQPFRGVETVNDIDGHVTNVWRAIAADPDAVAHYADWPVSEADLHPRHAVLVERRADVTTQLMGDPEWFDAKLAGWWVWGACAWIGSGWCSGEGPWVREGGRLVERNAGQGINRKLPHLGDAGRGINRKLPHLGGGGGGVGKGITTAGMRDAVPALMAELSARLRRVRIACGDWSRVLGDSVTWRHGVCGVLLDPPYTDGDFDYSSGGGGGALASDVAEWAREAGDNPLMRIALCGHIGEHDMPGWEVWRWKSRGGYGNQGGKDADDNRHRECIWFSPACNGARQPSLFDARV